MNFSLLGSQAVLIVCNDEDPIPDDQVHSNSVVNFLKQVKSSGIKIDENRWITLSWNECDEHFSTEKHKQYLVRVKELAEAKTEVLQSLGEYEAGQRYKNTATRRQDNFTPQLSHNYDGRQMDNNMDVDPVVPCNASQGRSSNAEHKGNIVWEGSLQSGTLHTTYQRPGWVPPDLLYRTVYEGNKNKSYTLFRVEETDDGGFNIQTDSGLVGMGKAFIKKFF